MTDDDYIHACWAMERFGGHFVSSLAKCYYSADGSNQAKLREAFQGYFDRYLEMYNRRRESE